MQASIVRLTHGNIDIKINSGDKMHILQWRRRFTHDEVLLDGKTHQTSYGLWGRETIYGLVFGRDENGEGGERVMLVVDPSPDISKASYWEGRGQPNGVRLECADETLIAYGTLDERAYDKPADFREWARKTFGMTW